MSKKSQLSLVWSNIIKSIELVEIENFPNNTFAAKEHSAASRNQKAQFSPQSNFLNREIRETSEPQSALGGSVWILRVFRVFRGSLFFFMSSYQSFIIHGAHYSMGWEKYAPYRREYFLGENGVLDLKKALKIKGENEVDAKKADLQK
jgi:hypothetical protein